MPGSAWGVEALRPSARACAPEEEDDDDLRGVKRLEGAEGKRKVARAQRRQADVIQFFGLIQGQGPGLCPGCAGRILLFQRCGANSEKVNVEVGAGHAPCVRARVVNREGVSYAR